MNDDRTLDGVERLLRDAAADTEPVDTDDDPRWEAFSLGDANSDDIRALEVEAATSELAANRLEAYRPIDRQTRQRFLERVQVALDSPAAEGARSLAQRSSAETAVVETPLPEASTAETVDNDGPTDSAEPMPRKRDGLRWQLRRGSVRRRRWLAPAAAALAATLLWVLWPQPPITLPDYTLTAEVGRRVVRSTAAGPQRDLELELGDLFEITLRPEHTIDQPVKAHVYVDRPGGLESVDLDSEVSDTGSIRLTGQLDHQLSDGASYVELWIVVAAHPALPELAEVERRRGGQTSSAGWQLLHCRLRVVSRGETEPS